MSDFAQSALISTLQQLNEAHLPRLEAELTAIAQNSPIALVLPCHGDDLARTAIAHIVGELEKAAWLSEIVVSTNAADDQTLADGEKLFGRLPQRIRFLRNDGEAFAAPGKGTNVWSAFRLLCEEARAAVIAVQDCDVASFRRQDLARLCYAIAEPRLGYAFAKMYYSRATDRLYGRVSRLFFAPLLQAIVRISGHLPLVDFLNSFRYPLAGECAMTREVAADLPLSSGWGLEAAMLCEVFRQIDPRAVCQVDAGSGYDHKHQPASSALAAMCGEIAGVLLAQLEREGLGIDAAFRGALLSAYRREAALAVRRSANLALINGLPFDAENEAAIVEAFSAALAGASAPSAAILPSWNTIARATRPS